MNHRSRRHRLASTKTTETVELSNNRDGKSWKFSSDYGGSSAYSKQQRLRFSPDRRTFNSGGYQDLELRAIDILNSVGRAEGSSNKTCVLANLNVSGRNAVNSVPDFRMTAGNGKFSNASVRRPATAGNQVNSQWSRQPRHRTGDQAYDECLTSYFDDELNRSASAVSLADRLVKDHWKLENQTLESGVCAQWIASRSRMCQSASGSRRLYTSIDSHSIDVNNGDVHIGINGLPTAPAEQQFDTTSVNQKRSEPVPLCWSDQVTRQRVKIMSPRPALDDQYSQPTMCDTRPVIFSTSAPDDSLRRYVVEILEKQNCLAERAQHQPESQTTRSSPVAESQERKYNVEASLSTIIERPSHVPDDGSLRATLLQSEGSHLVDDARLSFQLIDDRTQSRTRPNTSTGRSPRLIVPLVPNCSFPASYSTVPDVRVVGRASALSARTRPSSRTSGLMDSSRPQEPMSPVEHDIAVVPDVNGSANAVGVDTRGSETLGWPFLMVVKGYNKVQSDPIPSRLPSAVRPRSTTTAPTKLRDAAMSRSRNRAVASARTARPDFFVVSQLTSKVESKNNVGEARRDRVQDTREQTREQTGASSMGEQWQQTLLQQTPEVNGLDPVVEAPSRKALFVSVPTEHEISDLSPAPTQKTAAPPPPSRAESPVSLDSPRRIQTKNHE